MRKDKIVYDTQELRGYVEAGKTNVQIAGLMGVSTGTVAKWIRESGTRWETEIYVGDNDG